MTPFPSGRFDAMSKDELTDFQEIQDRDNAFTEWRQAKADSVADVASRIFALRKKGYLGCGFHWSLEKQLGSCIMMLNDYDSEKYYNTREAAINQAVLKVVVESLENRLSEAESGKNHIEKERVSDDA